MGEALDLLQADGAFVMGGGTSINGDVRSAGSDAVDIQALDVAGIETDGDSLHIGSMTLLQELVDSPHTPPTVSELARREAPNTIRNAATVGGTVGANDPESELLAGLLVFNARISVMNSDTIVEHDLAEILSDPRLVHQAIMTRISIDIGGVASAHRTGRTPMDRPIVMVAGRRAPDGTIRVAIAGVDATVVAVAPGHVGALDPPADFRGSSEYRRRLAAVLTERVLTDIAGGGS